MHACVNFSLNDISSETGKVNLDKNHRNNHWKGPLSKLLK